MRATEPFAKQRLLQIINSDLVVSIVDICSTIAMLAFARYSVLHRLSQAAAPVGAMKESPLRYYINITGLALSECCT